MSHPKLANPSHIIRPATKADIPGMTDCFFHSFNAKFWQYFMPDNEHLRWWWDKSWEKGLDNPTDVNFVAIDTEKGDKVIGFSRWMKPQQDGYQNREASWAEVIPEHWDMELTNSFFEGMDNNRLVLLEKRPHWCMCPLCLHGDYLSVSNSLVAFNRSILQVVPGLLNEQPNLTENTQTLNR
ncbi:hypothetical protein K431DRAFT_284078 [Polychaeton citri CBS 116435]|uniref:N-acetyltransferase domain-containing protein n=1 Tax=Polychaeton citri CBS 116435 TaxID=1314669 RepID=A0A9P4QA47_9PEZI|nr:hypothetical protein K431DRAFT_284078 [Polychaeton citri CBS 116435]